MYSAQTVNGTLVAMTTVITNFINKLYMTNFYHYLSINSTYIYKFLQLDDEVKIRGKFNTAIDSQVFGLYHPMLPMETSLYINLLATAFQLPRLKTGLRMKNQLNTKDT